MKAKEFVLQKYPAAIIKTQKWGKIKGQKQTRYYIHDSGNDSLLIASGTSESNAWANAKQSILDYPNPNKQ